MSEPALREESEPCEIRRLVGAAMHGIGPTLAQDGSVPVIEVKSPEQAPVPDEDVIPKEEESPERIGEDRSEELVIFDDAISIQILTLWLITCQWVDAMRRD